jgi:transposase InsO family protein
VPIDACSRVVVGRAMTDDLQTALALEARPMAFDRRHRVLGLDHIADRGSQLTTAANQAVLGAYDITG